MYRELHVHILGHDLMGFAFRVLLGHAHCINLGTGVEYMGIKIIIYLLYCSAVRLGAALALESMAIFFPTTACPSNTYPEISQVHQKLCNTLVVIGHPFGVPQCLTL